MNFLVKFLSYNFKDFNRSFLNDFSIIGFYILLNGKAKEHPRSRGMPWKGGPQFRQSWNILKKMLLTYTLHFYSIALNPKLSLSSCLGDVCIFLSERYTQLIIFKCLFWAISTCLTEVLRG